MFGSDHICYLRTNDLLMASDAGNGSVFILLDLSVTFDNAYHNILLKRLTSLARIIGSTLDWFALCLSDRTFSLRESKFFSATASLTHGAPQGSILGPLFIYLFILYSFLGWYHLIFYKIS